MPGTVNFKLDRRMINATEVEDTPLYTDVRLFAQAGIAGVIYGVGPRV
ncbi:hypothetical protein [Rhodoferax sp.]|nr:hypothetical protein [Rhodoferax sp.]